jgi:hypothetical protein
MYFKSKTTSLVLLGVTSIACTRIMLAVINDPEGPNLLVVMGISVIVYALSLAAYVFNFSGIKNLSLAIVIQIILVTGLYVCLN